jgi:hypothetical protein
MREKVDGLWKGRGAGGMEYTGGEEVGHFLRTSACAFLKAWKYRRGQRKGTWDLAGKEGRSRGLRDGAGGGGGAAEHHGA